jgi:hypothetical protein
MKIFTSYFSNMRNIINPVSIAHSNPYWYKGLSYSLLAPTSKILNEYKSNRFSNDKKAIMIYTDAYAEEILSKLDQEKVYEELHFKLVKSIARQISETKYSEEDIVTLLCWERPDKFCHRHLVARWFAEKGIEVKEISLNKDIQNN